MKDLIKGIVYSISYFSILPIRLNKFDANNSFYKGVVFGLPIVGFLLGLLISILFILLNIVMPNWYASIFVAIIYLFLYGFIHLEAVADTIDAWFASYSNKDVYEIIKEPQIGSIGAIGTFCFVLLKILAIAYLLVNEQFLILITILLLSRFSIIFALDLEFHFKSTFILSLQKSYKANTLVKLFLLPINILTKLILKKIKKQIGFLNGDTLGFNIELIEIVLLNIAIIII